MGQQLFKNHLEVFDSLINDTTKFKHDPVLSEEDDCDISFISSLKPINETLSNTVFLKKIQNQLSSLTTPDLLEEINVQINHNLQKNVFTSIETSYKEALQQIKERIENQQRLNLYLINKFDDALPIINLFSTDQQNQINNEQLSYFALQSLISILLILIKSAEKNDPVIIHQILTLTSQLCEQMPMKCFSSSVTNNQFLFKSIKPLISYMNELCLSNDSIISKEALRILLSFSIVKGSFKDILPLVNKLLFDTIEIYNVKGLFLQLNNGLTEVKQQSDTDSNSSDQFSFDYLKSVGVYPNSELMKLDEKLFTGQFISSIILANIDFHLNKQLKDDSIESSFAFEFHPDTFKQLFNMIEQLSAVIDQDVNKILVHSLIICLKLFRTHFKFLCAIKSNLERDLLTTNGEIKKLHPDSTTTCDLTMFINDNDLNKWFQLLLKLACNENQSSELLMLICKEASQTLVYVLNQKTSSFVEKLSFIHEYIIDHQYSLLTKEFLIEMNKKEVLLCWIENLCANEHDELSRTTAKKILFSFIDLYFDLSNKISGEEKQQIQSALLFLQQLLLHRLISRPVDHANHEFDVSSFISEYIAYIFKKFAGQSTVDNELFNSIIIGLCLMTKTNETLNFSTIQPIFANILPKLAEYLLENTILDVHIDNYRAFICWLIGRICYVMISGPPTDSLEIKYCNQLKSPVFIGGCERQSNETSPYLLNLYKSNLTTYSQFSVPDPLQESSSDREFLLSIYHNTGESAQLISKLKAFAKTKHHTIQESIKQQTNDLCAAIFAVYVKHYRRINPARSEILRLDQNKAPHHKLLSIFEYANHVQTLFATLKGQDGDCNEFYEQIKANTLFLLLSIKENNLIPIIEEEDLPMMTTTSEKKTFHYQRQNSRWTKAKYVIRLLKNIMKACIRFKKLMLAKKQSTIQKYDHENNLKQAIETFIYGRYYTILLLNNKNNDGKQIDLEEINQCLHRQDERAITRLITYRFCQMFIRKTLNLKNSDQILMILRFYLPQLRNSNVEWSYLEDLSAVNNQWQEEIRQTYYSIIQMILSSSLLVQSKSLVQNIFYLFVLPYESDDISHIYHQEFAITLFTSFISYEHSSFEFQLVGFSWFRFFVIKLCEIIQMDILQGLSNQILRRQRDLIFHTLILNELKKLKQIELNSSEDTVTNSLVHIAMDWFFYASKKETSILSNKLEIHLYTNQYLALLLHCIYYYEHIRSVCATVDYIEELLYIYHHSQRCTTKLLSLKVLRQLIPYLPETGDGKSSILIEKFLMEILFFIGENVLSLEILTELIYIYRTIMSVNSVWQIKAIELVLDSIQSYLNLKSIEINEQNQLNQLSASLYILGGYIHPLCLGSTVKILTDKQLNDEDQLAVIIEIDQNKIMSNTPDTKPYFVQYLQTNKREWFTIDQLQLEIVVLPPNLSSLPNTNLFIDSLIDTIGNFIQIDASVTESQLLLQLKRHSISVLYHLLNTQKLIEIFSHKPYVSSIANIAISNSLTDVYRPPADLRLFNQEHLEQYSLSLDTCQRLKQITDVDENISNDDELRKNQLILDTLSTSAWKYNGWKAYTTKTDIESFKKGRIGSKEISLVSMPRTAADMSVFQECGNKHKFKGHISLTSANTHVNLPTFIVNNLQVTEGKWYFCVRVPDAGIQIGWASNGFAPQGNRGVAIGDDLYSWSYDGARDILLHNAVYSDRFGTFRWKKDDVCGCGIEIDGENTNIKYWLNGTFLGTAFKHQSYIGTSSTECNLLPNESNTRFFPGVSIQFDNYPTATCDFIFSPEDMQQCPLPDGYKPLLLPKVIHMENSIVAYPYSAYLIDDDQHEYFYETRTMNSTRLLRDYVNQQHLDIDFNIADNHAILPETSLGFLLSIDNDITSCTISFDFQISSILNEPIDEQISIQLITSDIMQNPLSVQIPTKNIKENIRIVILLLLTEQRTKVYINDNNCQTFETHFQNINSKSKLDFYLLPMTSAKISNIALWKYALPDEQIHRLYTYGLFYVAIDHQQLKEYQKRVNTFSFTQHEFSNELLVPFDEPFEEHIWEQKKKEAHDNESKYFQSTLELFGNKTYLILDKTNNVWFEYTFILDISIPNWPNSDEQLTLVRLNETARVYINHENQLCLESNEITVQSHLKINLNEYFRLWISIRDQSANIYVNGSLDIATSCNNDHQFHATLDRFELFKQMDLSKDTTQDDNILRIQCQSITFLNRSIPFDEQMSKPNSSLETILAPPLSIIEPSLIAIGYKKEWISTIIKRYNTTHIQTIDTLIRKHKQESLEEDLKNQQNHCLEILSRLNSTIEQQKLSDLINSFRSDPDKQIAALSQLILTNSSNVSETSEENNWLHQAIHGLGINKSVVEGLQDKSTIASDSDTIYKLFDISQTEQKNVSILKKSKQYSHQNISRKQYLQSCIACEQGLTILYARDTIVNIIEIVTKDVTTSFPLEKFIDYTSLITLLRLMDYYETYTNEKNDRIILLIKSIIQLEIRDEEIQNEINVEILQNKLPFLFQLQKNIVTQIIQILLEPSLLDENFDDNNMFFDEQILIKQSSLNFILKILKLFVELTKGQHDIFISFLFPISMINLIFILFLIVPTHHSKFVLLQIFSNLIQKNNGFYLTDTIQRFLINLLTECPSMSDRLPKYFETIMIELIYLLPPKEKFQSKLTDLPQDIRDIYSILDIINLLTGDKRRRFFLGRFFEQSQDFLDGDLKLTEEEFEKSNNHFNINTDRELIHFMNKNFSLNGLISDFIATLPNEPTDENSTFYKNYPLLSNIPSDCIQTRIKFIYQLNQFIENILPLVDFNLQPGESYLIDKIRTIKMYLLYSTKFQLLDETLEKTDAGFSDYWLMVQFDTLQASSIQNNTTVDHTMFHQAYQQLHADAHNTFRRQDSQIWHTQYLGMHSTDQGGPYRDSISRICSDICSTRLPLFILCPNGRTNTGLNRDCWIPNVFPPNKPLSNNMKKQYRFIGQLMGMAIRKKHYLDLKLPLIFWKELLNEQITIEDIQSIDIQSFTIIGEIEKNIEQTKSMDNNNNNNDQDINYVFNSIMSDLRFDVVSSAGQTYELIPNGTNIPITTSNFKQYCTCYRQYRLNEFHRQIDFIRQGLFSIVPSYYLNLFTAKELEEAICGQGQIDVELLKRNTDYRGRYNKDSPVIQRFWTVFSDTFNDEERKAFLIFVWGRNTLPRRDEDFESNFSISLYEVDDEQVDRVLPRSHTCSFALDLPEYSTTEIMYERLKYAITHCSSIDGDGNMNDFNAMLDVDSDSDSDSDEE